MNEHFYAVIMAGGGGTRLWPLSRQNRPKQMLRLVSDRTLFQMATDRLQGLFPVDHIYVVTVADQATELQKQSPNIPAENYILEPMPRGTASVVGLAAVVLQKRDPEAVMAVLTADHYIENVAGFQQILSSAQELARKDFLVTLGIQPTFPATGYGYIQRGELLGHYGQHDAYRVLRFKEKPNEETARGLLQRGDHFWNSGMFIWRVDRIQEEFSRQMGELYQTLEQIAKSWGTAWQTETLKKLWPQIKPQTIDYGIMEHAQQVAVLPGADLGWSDVGSWDSLFDVLPGDPNGNIHISAMHLGIDTRDTLVCTEDPNRLVVTIGVKNLIIVDAGDALLVCPRDDAQKVRELVKLLDQNGYQLYL
ncbi:mannose-1-phosphate guanylyltransferase [Longilinea arvoryzae]|uniref:mannose-1-phosphate guanylyltransferase n=1 Tax=Longilinea arvoryzae TaxID=360412 RepID=A0A0S7BJN8_9CHLR|nr:mannose-1-phosphate guanylyltransferase [Longilinea arvoryzae]GAP14402.1 mannose-1-phosphate guanylyltransferase [Longilinea arvoryzae]